MPNGWNRLTPISMARYKAHFSISYGATYGSFEGNNKKQLVKDVKDHCKAISTKEDGAYFSVENEEGHIIDSQRMFKGTRKFVKVG